MTAFVLVAACLLGGALLFLLPPLWRRWDGEGVDAQALTLSVFRDKAAELRLDLAQGQLDPEHYAEARGELARRLALELPALSRDAAVSVRARLPFWLLALLLPLGAVGVYRATGTPEALDLLEARPAPAAGHPVTQADVLAMINRLAARLADKPGDKDGWAMLGRSYIALGRYPDAATAFGKAVELDDRDVGVLIEYADLLGYLQGKDLRGRPARAARLAEIDNRFKEGVAMLRAGRPAQAAVAFHRVLELAPRLADAHVNLGYALLGMERPEAARDFFLSAIEIKPDQVNAYYGLAVCLEALDDLPGALGAMRTYVHRAPADGAHVIKAKAAIWEWEEALKKGGKPG